MTHIFNDALGQFAGIFLMSPRTRCGQTGRSGILKKHETVPDVLIKDGAEHSIKELSTPQPS